MPRGHLRATAEGLAAGDGVDGMAKPSCLRPGASAGAAVPPSHPIGAGPFGCRLWPCLRQDLRRDELYENGCLGSAIPSSDEDATRGRTVDAVLCKQSV